MLDEMMNLICDGDYNTKYGNDGRKFMTVDAAVNLALIFENSEKKKEGASC